MIMHLALSHRPLQRRVACGSDRAVAVRLCRVDHAMLPRTTSPRIVTCGNCKRTRRYREAQIERR